MFKLIYSNLLQRPTRTGVSILAVSLGVGLILITVGLSYGQLRNLAERTQRIGGDFMFQPLDGSVLFAIDSGVLSVHIREVIEKVEGVEAVTPILVKFLGDKFHLVFGIDVESFQRVNRSLRFVDGRLFETPDEVIIDTNYAYSGDLQVGNQLELLGHTFTISGVFQEGTAARVLLPMTTLQEINGTPEKATVFFIRASDHAQLEVVYDRLKERFRHYKITKTADLQEIMVSSIPAFRHFVITMVFISVGVSFLIILLAMYSTIMERTREIGILRSLGASKSYIVRLIIRESLLICTLGVATGFLLTFVATEIILMTFPSIPVTITPFWRVMAAVIAIVGGTLGAVYPAVKAARLDPVRALGYE